eukprot:scaffold659_cov192-Ochromonas_danica.AAC.39
MRIFVFPVKVVARRAKSKILSQFNDLSVNESCFFTDESGKLLEYISIEARIASPQDGNGIFLRYFAGFKGKMKRKNRKLENRVL